MAKQLKIGDKVMPCDRYGMIAENVKGTIRHIREDGLYYIDWDDGAFCEEGMWPKYLILIDEPNDIMKKLL